MATEITPEMLHQLLTQHSAALELYARQWSDTPEDCVQEALVKLAALADCPEQPIAWLYRVVRNAAISQRRGEQRRKRREALAAEMAATWFEQNRSRSFDIEDATRALSTLDDDQREIVIARIWGGLSFEQISELIDASTTTAFRKYEAALKQLRTRLESEWTRNNISIRN